METLKRFLVESWRSKLVSLFIALSIWYLIKSHLSGAKQDFPVPGTTPSAPASGPALEDSLLGPLIPTPVTIPVPGGGAKG